MQYCLRSDSRGFGEVDQGRDFEVYDLVSATSSYGRSRDRYPHLCRFEPRYLLLHQCNQQLGHRIRVRDVCNRCVSGRV